MKESKHKDNLIKKGILVDEHGLLKPDLENLEKIKTKIASNLREVKRKIDQLINKGKHIIYLPGSYDLVHAGHASYMDQAISWYLSLPQNSSLKREDLVVLVLADDDDMIFQNKSSKWEGNGGKEKFRRPIQSEKVFRKISSDHNWRLLELASLPQVDIVAFIPSPISASYLAVPEIIKIQKNSQEVRDSLENFKNTNHLSLGDFDALKNAIDDYEKILDLSLGDRKKIVTAFENNVSPWSIQSWQLFLHTYLGFGKFPAPFVRIVSHGDIVYKDQVNFLMQIAGLQVLYFEDEKLVSTTELLEKHGHEKLLEAKIKNYKKQ